MITPQVIDDFDEKTSAGGRFFSQWTTQQITTITCVPALAFTPITFKNATMVQSNLGGQGGRCVDTYYTDEGVSVPWSDLCEEAQPGTPPNPVDDTPDTPCATGDRTPSSHHGSLISSLTPALMLRA